VFLWNSVAGSTEGKRLSVTQKTPVVHGGKYGGLQVFLSHVILRNWEVGVGVVSFCLVPEADRVDRQAGHNTSTFLVILFRLEIPSRYSCASPNRRPFPHEAGFEPLLV
jgi:hypothetical protein